MECSDFVTPAQAGVQDATVGSWIPACAGMTKVTGPCSPSYRVENLKIVVLWNFWPGAQDGGREVQLVGRIRKVLRFQAEAIVIAVNLASLALEALHAVGRVELHAGLRRADLQCDAARWLVDPCGQIGRAGRTCEHVAVVVAPRLRQFLDARADGFRFREVERGPPDSLNLARRDQVVPRGGVQSGANRQSRGRARRRCLPRRD